ncbi:hypothetical protein PMAYCL1PPCAC_07322, partial [Pristionchus mayeri]
GSKMTKSNPHDEQLQKQKDAMPTPHRMTTSNGAPVPNKNAVLTAGRRGPMLMQDVVYMDEMAHFDRERIPERVVHAKGAGAHGYFEVTHDITKYCKADMFSKVGKQTPMFIRFSTVGGESGSADTARDPRGFAMKFYTDEGNWDLVGNNTPIFFIRDPILFPNFIHTQKRNPQTHLKDMNMMWDFFSLRPESTHQMMFLFSDRGTPYGYRFMNGYGSHTFKMVNAKGEPVYCKFHFKTNQGIKCLSASEAGRLTGEDPDFAIRDLFDSIERGDYPQWNLFIQVMSFDQAEKWKFNPFDVTKVWPHGEFPLIPVGKFVLNRNPQNYFAEVEQSAFCPAHVVPGIEFSPDKMLQGRLFSYTDTHFHRLGPNYIQLPINCPFRSRPHNTQRDGAACLYSQGGAPNYHPNSFNGPVDVASVKDSAWKVTGDVDRFNTHDDNNFDQPRDFWLKTLDEGHRTRLVENIVSTLKDCKPFIIDRALSNFKQVHPDMCEKAKKMIEKHRNAQPHYSLYLDLITGRRGYDATRLYEDLGRITQQFLTEECYEDLQLLHVANSRNINRESEGVTDFDASVYLRALDASGKLGNGIAGGQFMFGGDFKACRAINYQLPSRDRPFQLDSFRYYVNPMIATNRDRMACLPELMGLHSLILGVCLPASCSSLHLLDVLRPPGGIPSIIPNPICSLVKINDGVPQKHFAYFVVVY